MLDIAEAEMKLSSECVGVRTMRDGVAVTGADAAEYLQGQLSQDVVGLPPGSAAETLLLTPQGHLEAWLRVTRVGDAEFWLDADRGAGPDVAARISRFAIRVDVHFETFPIEMVAVRGKGAAQLATAAEIGVWTVPPLGGEGLVVEGVDLLGRSVGWPSGVPEGPASLLDLLRIRQGLPCAGAEITEATIPASVGDVNRAVSFTKGCYVGQELVARIDSRGAKTPYSLVLVHVGDGDGLTPSELIGTPLVVEGAEVGRVTSAVESARDGIEGLAMVKRGTPVPGQAQLSTGAEVQLRNRP